MKNRGIIDVAVLGCGYRGQYLLKLLHSNKLYNVVAAADSNRVELVDKELPFYDGENCLGRMLGKHHPDLIVIASVWDTHYAYAMHALNSGCNVALEVKGALYEGEYEQIVDAARRNRRRVFFLENTAFDLSVMSVVRMCGEGLLGEVLWARGAYRHDLRDLFFSQSENEHWRKKYYQERYGDIYPTHSIAPVIMAMNAANGECKFKSIGSFATGAVGASLFSGKDEKCTLGDIVTTVIVTDRGGQIILTHDTTLPRPKSFEYEVQGSLGVWSYERRALCIEGVGEAGEWCSDAEFVERYKDSLWVKYGVEAMEHDAHHSGMDYVMLCSVAEDLTAKSTYPISDEQMVAWANISLFSHNSIRDNKREYL